MVVQRRHGPVLLSVNDELEGACFPTQDPRLYRLNPRKLADRAGDSFAGLCLQAAVAREQDPALVSALDQVIPRDIDERFALEWARAAVTDPGLPAGLPRELGAALSAGEGGFGACWLAHRFRLLDDLAVQLRALFDRRFGVPAAEPSVSDICCRALLGFWLRTPEFEPLPFMEANISAMRLSAHSHQSTLPEAAEICWLAETLKILAGDERESAMGESFDIPLERIGAVVTEALWRWSTAELAREADLRAVTDAIWMARKTGTEGYFLRG